MKKFFITFASILGFAPLFAFAQLTGTPLANLFNLISSIISTLIPIAVGVAVLFFFYQLIKYIKSQGDDKAMAMKGIWQSLLAIFIMLAFMGIIRLVASTVFAPGQGIGNGISTGNDIPGFTP